MAESNSGLLIAALVAIVAVVGLVILFKGGSTGQAFVKGVSLPHEVSAPVANADRYFWGVGLGEQISNACSKSATDQVKCCDVQCGNICATGDECFEGCRKTCFNRVAQAASSNINKYD